MKLTLNYIVLLKEYFPQTKKISMYIRCTIVRVWPRCHLPVVCREGKPFCSDMYFEEKKNFYIKKFEKVLNETDLGVPGLIS